MAATMAGTMPTTAKVPSVFTPLESKFFIRTVRDKEEEEEDDAAENQNEGEGEEEEGAGGETAGMAETSFPTLGKTGA